MFKQKSIGTELVQNRAGAKLSPGHAEILILAFFLITTVFLISYSNRDDYNGDAINMVVPMFHLGEAKRGELLIYRYAWQPLCYELGAVIFQITKSPTAVYLMAPIAGAVSLLLLLLMTWRDRTSIAAFVVSLVMLLAIPEFWYSSLYFNPMIIGLPFILLAMALLASRSHTYVSLMAGLLVGVAILFRLDFILICPALALVAWQKDRSLIAPIALAIGVLISLACGFFAGWLDPSGALEIYRSAEAEIVEKAHMPGWDLRLKLGVLSVMFSPIGFAILLFGGPSVVYRSLRRDALMTLLWALALTPTIVPLLNLLTDRYVIPFLIFVPPFMRECLSEIELKVPKSLKSWPLPVATIGSIVLLFVSFSFYGHSPFIEIGTLASRPVPTHGGPRSYGGYWWQVAEIRRPAQRNEQQLAAGRILDEIRKPIGPDLLIAGSEDYFDHGGIGWRLVQLALEQSGFDGKLIAPHEIQFDVNNRKVTLVRDLYPDTMAQLDRGHEVILYDLRG